MEYSVLDLIIVWFAGMVTSGFFVYYLCRTKNQKLSKEDAKTLKHVLGYASLDFRQAFRNGFPIENDPTLSLRFSTWAAANVFVKRMTDILEKW